MGLRASRSCLSKSPPLQTLFVENPRGSFLSDKPSVDQLDKIPRCTTIGHNVRHEVLLLRQYGFEYLALVAIAYTARAQHQKNEFTIFDEAGLAAEMISPAAVRAAGVLAASNLCTI